MAYLALYGTVGIVREYCQGCCRTALVVDGVKQCCDKPLVSYAQGYKRMVGAEPKRRSLKKWEKEAILTEQENRCLYCGHTFGALVRLYRGRRLVEVFLKVQWDHVLPFIHTYNNDLENFAAACQICNHYKRDRIFTDLEEARIYVAERWERASSNVGKTMPTVQNILSD